MSSEPFSLDDILREYADAPQSAPPGGDTIVAAPVPKPAAPTPEPAPAAATHPATRRVGMTLLSLLAVLLALAGLLWLGFYQHAEALPERVSVQKRYDLAGLLDRAFDGESAPAAEPEQSEQLLAPMTDFAVKTPSAVVYWSSLLTMLAAAAGFALAMALYVSHGGKALCLWLWLPTALLLTVLLTRLLGRFVPSPAARPFCAVLAAALLAGLPLRLFGLTQNLPRLYDCLAPGLALSAALNALGGLFTGYGLGAAAITRKALQSEPFSLLVSFSSARTEWRLACCLLQAVLALLSCGMLLLLFHRRRRWPMKAALPRDGNIALLFLVFYGAISLATDGVRLDAVFLPGLAWLSLEQLVGLALLGLVLLVFSIRSLRAEGFRFGLALRLLCWGAGLALCLLIPGGKAAPSAALLVGSLCLAAADLAGFYSLCQRKAGRRTTTAA